jgi:hypothetical protein
MSSEPLPSDQQSGQRKRPFDDGEPDISQSDKRKRPSNDLEPNTAQIEAANTANNPSCDTPSPNPATLLADVQYLIANLHEGYRGDANDTGFVMRFMTRFRDKMSARLPTLLSHMSELKLTWLTHRLGNEPFGPDGVQGVAKGLGLLISICESIEVLVDRGDVGKLVKFVSAMQPVWASVEGLEDDVWFLENVVLCLNPLLASMSEPELGFI